jgi:hypothetical protein
VAALSPFKIKPLSLHYEGEIPESNQINERGSTFEWRSKLCFLIPLLITQAAELFSSLLEREQHYFASVSLGGFH